MTTELIGEKATGILKDSNAQRSITIEGPFRVTKRSGILSEEPDQTYFWTEEWQKGEREADEDIAAGRVQHFDSADDAITFLRGLRT